MPHTPHTLPETDDPASDNGLPRACNIALAHDWLVGYRGGEAVLDRLVQLIESDVTSRAPTLYTMFDDGRPLTPAIDALRHEPSFLNRFPFADHARRWLLPLYPAAVRNLSRKLAAHCVEPDRRIDLLISTSSAAVHGIAPPAGVPHLCYCHTPARYLWSQSDQYDGGLRGLGLQALGPTLRKSDRAASRHVTHWIANSTHTKSEIERCFAATARVVFPPVRTTYFTPAEDVPHDESRDHLPHPTLATPLPPLPSSFLLVAGALEPYKRVDLAINAALIANRPLVIAGSGSQSQALRTLAARRSAGHHSLGSAPAPIMFLGRISDAHLRDAFRKASMLLFPQIEDFGITAVEAQACGTPVVALARGGALDTVIDGVTGVHVPEQSAESFALAIANCPTKPMCTHPCRANAERFSESTFDRQMLGSIREALASAPLAPHIEARSPSLQPSSSSI